MPDDEVYVQHRFTIEREGHTFSDALVLPETEYRALTKAQIAERKRARFDAWRAALNRRAPELSRAERRAMLRARREQLVAEQAQIDAELETV